MDDVAIAWDLLRVTNGISFLKNFQGQSNLFYFMEKENIKRDCKNSCRADSMENSKIRFKKCIEMTVYSFFEL